MTSMGEDAVPAVEAEMSDPEMDEWMNAPAGPYAPALETVEAQDGGAAWERGEEAEGFVRWTLRKSNGFPKVMRWIDSDVEAAIRAPLEERIDHLERLLRDLHAAGEVDGRNALSAENAKLRDALVKLLSAFDNGDLRCDHYDRCLAHPDRVRNRGTCDCGLAEVEDVFESIRALATSSTEATV